MGALYNKMRSDSFAFREAFRCIGVGGYSIRNIQDDMFTSMYPVHGRSGWPVTLEWRHMSVISAQITGISAACSAACSV